MGAGWSYKLFNGYLNLPYSFHLQKNSAELFRNITGEVAMFANGGISTGVMLINEIMVILGIGVLLLVVEPIGTIIVVSVLVLAGWSFNYITKQHIANWGEARQYHDGLRIQHLQQGLNGVKDGTIDHEEIIHEIAAMTGISIEQLSQKQASNLKTLEEKMKLQVFGQDKAINTIVEERTVRDLIPKLRLANAQGIVEYPLNKIVI